MKGDWVPRDSDGDCPFCAISRGEAAADVVYEDDRSVAFLDRRPVFPGHVLVIPRAHVPTLADLPDGAIGPFFTLVRTMSLAVQLAVEADGTFVAVNSRVSQSVPHLHVHVVPRRHHDGLRGFFWPRHAYADDAEREAVRRTVAAAVPGIASPPANGA